MFVPAIVEREESLPLAEVVRRAIDRNYIAGLKPSAAQGIAEGIATQMREAFLAGKGVKFGQYFYARLYLTGTTDANGKLTDKNKVAVRLYKGSDFDLSLDDFSWRLQNAETQPVLDFAMNVNGDERNVLRKTGGIQLFGRNLAGFSSAYNSTVIVQYTDAEGAKASTSIHTPDSSSDNSLRWNEFPESLRDISGKATFMAYSLGEEGQSSNVIEVTIE